MGAEGNGRLKRDNFQGALDKYDEGIYIMDKCKEVLLTWRLIFRQIHQEKAEKDKKENGLKESDLVEPPMPAEFQSDFREELQIRIALLLNAAQAALKLCQWDIADARASLVIELDPGSLKA